MRDKIAAQLLLMCLTLTFSAVHGAFSSSKLFSKGLEDFQKLRTFTGLSIASCEKECRRKRRCQGLIYNRMAAVCILTPTLPADQHQIENIGWVLIDVINHADPVGQKCGDTECRLEETCITNEQEGTCKVTECGPPPSMYTSFHGNMYAVDNTIVVNVGNLRMGITCGHGGLWNSNNTLDDVLACPDDYHAHQNRCFHFSTSEAIWSEAQQFCEANGGSLANIEDLDTQIFVSAMVEYTDEESLVKYHTGVVYEYHSLHDLGVDITGSSSTVFSVKACNDVHIALSTGKETDDINTYETAIGGWGNTKSVIRDTPQSTPKAVDQSYQLLSCSEYRPFWISWSNHVIRIGTGNDVGATEFLSWNDPYPHDVNYVSVSTGWGSTGDWLFPQYTYMPGKFWIGADDLEVRGEWLWQPGTTLVSTGYTAWAPGEPSNVEGSCLAMDLHNNMQWRPDICHEPRNFICEKSGGGIVDVG